MEDVVIITTTAVERRVLEEIAEDLLADRLVACVQILGPLRSLYWWKGRVEEADEWMAVMKTRESLYTTVEEAITRLHPYEVPQIVAVKPAGLAPPYHRWVCEETANKV
jgi:periplasmic divalent cation tolerance protein